MPESPAVSIESIVPHLNLPQVEKLLIEGQRKFSGFNLDDLQLNELPMNFFAVDFSGASCVRTNFSGKTFTKTSFAGADLSGANFMGATFADNVTLDEAIIHGAAFYGATAKEYGNEENIIEQLLSRCIVSSSTRLPHVHFSALDQETRHWILITKSDPNETFRALMQNYLEENSGLLKFFSTEGRYRAVVALYMQTHTDGTFDNFVEYLSTHNITVDRTSSIYRRLEFVNDWYGLNREQALNQLLPPAATKEIGAGNVRPPSIPSLVKMVACELSLLIINKIKDWFIPETIEPDEEN